MKVCSDTCRVFNSVNIKKVRWFFPLFGGQSIKLPIPLKIWVRVGKEWNNHWANNQYLVAATSIDKISMNTVIHKWQQMCCMTCCIDIRSVRKEKKVWQWNVTQSTRSSSPRLLLFLKRRTAKRKYYLYNISIITKKWWTFMKKDGPTGTCRPVMPYCSWQYRYFSRHQFHFSKGQEEDWKASAFRMISAILSFFKHNTSQDSQSTMFIVLCICFLLK